MTVAYLKVSACWSNRIAWRMNIWAVSSDFAVWPNDNRFCAIARSWSAVSSSKRRERTTAADPSIGLTVAAAVNRSSLMGINGAGGYFVAEDGTPTPGG